MPPFSSLPPGARDRLAQLLVERRLADGEVVVREGAPEAALHVVREGRVRVRSARAGERLLEAGEGFGEMSLLDGGPSELTATAAGAAVTMRLGRDPFRRLLTVEPALAAELLPGVVALARAQRRREAGQARAAGTGAERTSDARPGADAPEELDPAYAAGWLQVLPGAGIFAGLAGRDLRYVARYMNVERFETGATVVRAGAAGDAMDIVLGGRAHVLTPDGHTNELGPDESFGELSLFDGAPRSATVSAVSELTIAKLRRADLERLLEAEPAIAVGLLDGVARVVRLMREAATDA